jgi:cytochrome c-type biogenesis protein CcmH/NrfF
MRLGPGTFLLLACLSLAGPAHSDELAELRRSRALAEELMSPFCPGRTLSDCPSPNAQAVREEIRAWIRQGRSDAEIRAELATRFGHSLAGEPQSAWGRAIPLLVIAAIGLLFAWGVRRVVARPES